MISAGTADNRVRVGVCACVVVFLAGAFADAEAQSLRGGRASMQAQYQRAIEYDYNFLLNAAEVRHFVNLNLLVPLKGNRDYQIDDEVSFPYARPEVRTFVERLSRQYRAACGEVLVVTSLTRPKSHQPRNASLRSVHPTGMAVDLRRSNTPSCRRWIQRVLLQLEGAGTLEATHERHPPHYHIAVYTKEYARYVAALEADQATVAATEPSAAPRTAAADRSTSSSAGEFVSYRVRRGDSLWGIARAYGTTVSRLKAANKLTSSRIYAGQWLEVPVNSR